jgi:hypothetical protein
MVPMNIHVVRIDGVNHGVTSMRNDLKRAVHTICGIRLSTVSYQHRPGGYPYTTMTCDTDIRFTNAMADLAD